ncbi:MAG: efflux transporter periplasmic adaptor subunit [Rhizobiales bacterium PAR1]|nr:MAG: efflux transporter periplasmic adaptor subunit [Rhizobiales bacterium PAR1]
MTEKTSNFLRIGLPLALICAAGYGLTQTEQGKKLATQGQTMLTSIMGTASAAKPEAPRRGPPAGIPVTVHEVSPQSVPVTLSAIGTVQPLASVALKARIDSQVAKIHVEEGALVKVGDLIMTLDDRTLKAQLAQFEAQVAKDDAQISQAERDVARVEDLLERKIGTMVQKDTALTALKALKAQRAADLAQVLNITTQLGFTEVRATIPGRIGSITAKPGALVRSADTAAMATINQIDPILVAVAVPQAMLPDLKASMTRGPVPVEAMAGSTTAKGIVAFIENGVDAATGTVMIKAKMDNPLEALWPGAFVRATVTLSTDASALTVPLVAVQTGQSGPYVFLVDAAGNARQTPVTVARTLAEEVVLTAGVKPGDKVVTSGQLRLINGAPVQIQSAKPPAQKPAASAEPPKRG